jgi:hypothetical protein
MLSMLDLQQVNLEDLCMAQEHTTNSRVRGHRGLGNWTFQSSEVTDGITSGITELLGLNSIHDYRD